MEQEQDRGSVGHTTATSAALDQPDFYTGLAEGKVLESLYTAWSCLVTARHTLVILVKEQRPYVHKDDIENLQKLQDSIEFLRSRISGHKKVEKLTLVCSLGKTDVGT